MAKEKNFKITSGKGYKAYYQKLLGFTVPFKVIKVAQDQSTGAEMAILEVNSSKIEKQIFHSKYWMLVYSSGDYIIWLDKKEAEKYFNKHIKAGDLI